MATTVPTIEISPPTIPQSPVTAVASEKPRDRALILLLIAFLGLIGYRWFQDSRFTARPVSEGIQQKIDLNGASKAELQQLPGVGPAKADKIVAQRDAQGKLTGLQSVPGFGSKTVERLQNHVQNEYIGNDPDLLTRKATPSAIAVPKSAPGKKVIPETGVAINSASLAELQKLPGIGAVLAQRIVSERDKKKFETVDDLRRVSGIGAKKLDAIRPYIMFE